MVGRICCIMGLIAVSVGFLSSPAGAQSGRVFYIDYASGSNSSGGTQSSPWKTHPYMQTGSGCTGGVAGWGGYAHHAGDHFIFKGGVTWPAACFGMTISAGGTSASTVSGAGQAPTINGADYYGVDTNWYSGGSFTRPIFDAGGSIPAGDNGAIIIVTANNVTLDGIETAHNQVTGGSTCDTATVNLGTTSGVVIDRMYLHDWTISNLANIGGHQVGSVCETVGSGSYNDNVYNTEMSDVATTASSPFGACWIGLGEVAYTNCHDVGEGGLFTEGAFHDNQIHDLDGSPVYPAGVHTNGYESDGWPPPFYNNLMYNLNIDYNVLCFSGRGTYFYNNVIYASKVADMAFDTSSGDGCSSSNSNQTYIYNNTLEANGAYYGGYAHAAIRVVGPPSRPGTLTGLITLKNNISIGNGFDLSQATTTPVQTNNVSMTSSEASTYGFVPANKMRPSSSDPNVSGQGTNLTTSCTAILVVLCQDASGTPWFGQASITRPTGSTAWDLGAFNLGGTQSASSQPSPPTNLTATVR